MPQSSPASSDYLQTIFISGPEAGDALCSHHQQLIVIPLQALLLPSSQTTACGSRGRRVGGQPSPSHLQPLLREVLWAACP